MSAPFLICALPRSGTAWLANWLNCEHEGFAKLGLDGLNAHLATGGDVDTAAVLALPKIREAHPSLPIAVVRRNPSQVYISLRNAGVETQARALAILSDRLAQAAAWPGVFLMDYENLDSERCSRALLSHIAPGETFDAIRWERLRGFNVQVTPEMLKKGITQGFDIPLEELNEVKNS